MQTTKLAVAETFGTSLDEDNYSQFKDIIDENCEYEIGDKTLVGPDEISDLYERNMKEGHEKFDKLVWGKSHIIPINDDEYEVHFSDHLTHKGLKHNYRCKQILNINDKLKVTKIIHCEIGDEKERLIAFYKEVGLHK